MKDYKRLTIRNDDGTWGVNYLELANEVAKWQEQHATQYLSTDLTNILGEKLAELEDKIENGTLVELPLIQQLHQGVWEVYFFNTRINGVMCYLFTDEDAAEAKFRELKGEREQ